MKGDLGGTVSVGTRSVFSYFNNGSNGDAGYGIGGQFRVRTGNRVNTEWFLDRISGNIGNFAHRTDLHIGWSVLYYLLPVKEQRTLLQPYILAGHCFDHTLQVANADPNNRAERWSSAVQAGMGTHFRFTDRTDLSLVAQYMVHLGRDVHSEWEDGEVHFEDHGASLEGHLLVNISFNYTLFDAW